MRLIKDPVEKMQAKQSIMRILYDAQDQKHVKHPADAKLLLPCITADVPQLIICYTTSANPYTLPPASCHFPPPPHQPPGTFLGMYFREAG